MRSVSWTRYMSCEFFNIFEHDETTKAFANFRSVNTFIKKENAIIMLHDFITRLHTINVSYVIDTYTYDKNYPVIVKVINRGDFNRINECPKFPWN